jgi:dTDP-4-dehydrorhamnose 3,5-epimerase
LLYIISWNFALVVTPTSLPDVLLIEPTLHTDSRGWLVEGFNAAAFEKATGCVAPFVQDNISSSSKNVLRGLHWQFPRGQGKLVSCMSGSVFDVAVDIRPKSATFGQSVGVLLAAVPDRAPQMLWIPEGFAHGFLALEDRTRVAYKLTDYFVPDQGHVLAWNDPALAIDWPLHGAVPITSAKDQAGTCLAALRESV